MYGKKLGTITGKVEKLEEDGENNIPLSTVGAPSFAMRSLAGGR